MYKAKILVLGPCESGKTAISNFLADATDTSGGEYHATQGVRILEFETNLHVGGRLANAEVELWDCSGNQKFETCWPAFMKDTNGVVMVYNPDQSNHDKQLEMWYSNFVVGQGLRDSQCIIFAHQKPNSSSHAKVQLGSTMAKVTQVSTNLEEDHDGVRTHFANYLSKLFTAMTDKRDQEELSIIN
ncbi:intraflagellar transport protein 22 homolog [Saccoglossus kowalevskii]|uniref:Rab-like protein 5-like n=1 Tax=Saccoglossus kowalevskii TaxID=10224 RepID=A0ABM0GRY8_SACKO|nr:PREDICTED: rab-like protein 5-like [Saccoglossus kowalevskii]